MAGLDLVMVIVVVVAVVGADMVEDRRIDPCRLRDPGTGHGEGVALKISPIVDTDFWCLSTGRSLVLCSPVSILVHNSCS